jgi:O-antigen ligase
MLKNLQTKSLFLYLSFFLLIEILSYFSLNNSALNIIVFTTLSIVSLAAAIYRLEYGLLIVFGELLIGSMGRMFVVNFGGFDLSIRMSFWAIIMLVFAGKFLWSLKKHRKESGYLQAFKNFHFKYYFLIIGAFFILGVINALIGGNDKNLIFSDANGWLYYLLILPTIIVYTNKDNLAFKNLTSLFKAAVIWLSLKTFWLLYVFTHNLSFSSEVYFWLRKTLVGEMTATLTGWPRIFIQGQVFSALGLFFAFWTAVSGKITNWKKISLNIITAALFAGVLLISFSRSFWLALLVTVVSLLICTWIFFSFKKMFIASAWLIVVFLISFALLYLTSVFPYPRSGSFNADFAGRVDIGNTEEAAISSRWSLLPVLTGEIKKSPFFGQGYGTTVTYISNDPRVLERDPSGSYTTHAFEWGYLDIWLKIGLLGLATYLALIFSLIKNAWKISLKNKDVIILGLIGAFIFIAITNFFTPYLNHPLGIGIIVVGACLISKYKVY